MTDIEDPELSTVFAEINRLDPDGVLFARVLRRTYDQIYDGQHMRGRFRWEQLSKTEKTHFGSILEINLQREFSIEDGESLDFAFSDVDVDCKWSQRDGGWMLPPEAVGKICLLITGSEQDSLWSAGLVRADQSRLSTGTNRDEKKTLNSTGKDAIHWIWRNAPLPENVLLHIDASISKAIMEDLAGPRRGQRRLDELFRRVPNRVIGRGVIATVTQQDDYMKRVRANGGSRGNLKREGIVIFGDYTGHRELAKQLGLPAIGDGDSMSARLMRIDSPAANSIQIDSKWYRVCHAGEDPTTPAPDLPKAKRSGPEPST